MNIRSVYCILFLSVMLSIAMSCRKPEAAVAGDGFVKVSDGRFEIDGRPYEYIGTNFWYGAILASEGSGGDRARLHRELDLLDSAGVRNLRILVGAEGREGIPSHISPVLQTSPGVYNDTLLRGLDYLLSELEKRDMKAVLYLGNAWEWSGGYAAYLEWAGKGEAPVPSVDGWPRFMEYVSQFVFSDSAKAMYADHVRYIVGRENSVTGRKYSDSPAIMSWQIANEPRAFSEAGKKPFAEWIEATASLIKSIDPAHLVSVGSEGSHGCETDLELWTQIHRSDNIDYATMHLWPYNWGWVTECNLADSVDIAVTNAKEYIGNHVRVAKQLGKPLVLEEFGYPRDGFLFAENTPVTGRDRFYDKVFEMVANDSVICGCNFWAWGGYGSPAHTEWQPGDNYCGDPAQEQQGLNSVFATDSTTIALIRKHTKEMF
ncbi:MAG: cellulase family glycosylhydrolase [Muribaculaceae bacterium]|nr:cellulase family glycosylhydrolase [Muribaculaceae bacterium]